MFKDSDHKSSSPLTDGPGFLLDLQRMDGSTWENLLALYSSRLHRDIVVSLRRRGLSPEEAVDVQQDTWLTAVRRIGELSYQGHERLYHWLRAISLNHIRNLKARQQALVSLEAIQMAPSGNFSRMDNWQANYHVQADRLVEEQVCVQEQLRLLENAMLSLKPRERGIIWRRFVWEEKPDQLAVRFGKLKARSISQMLVRFKNRVKHMA